MNKSAQAAKKANGQIFSGNIYIFHAFDVGYEIDLDDLKESKKLIPIRKLCPNCNIKNDDIDKFCAECGIRL